MKSKYSLLCDYSTHDLVGKVIAVGIFEKMFPQSFPYVHPSFYFVTSILYKQSEITSGNFSIKILDSKLIPIIPDITGIINIPKKYTGMMNIVLNIRDVLFEKPDDYILQFKIDDKIVTEETISVHKRED